MLRSIVAERLYAGYGRKTVVPDITFSIHAATWVSLIGANGAGKTTLLRTLGGLRKPQSGSIRLNGEATTRRHRELVISVPDPSELPGHLTGTEIIEILARERSLGVLADWPKHADIFDAAHWADFPVSTLSLGARKKLCLATAFCTSAWFYLLDEAFDGLDALSSRRIRKYMRSRMKSENFGVFSASHAWDLVFSDSDRVIFLKDGRIVNDLFREQFAEYASQSDRLEAFVSGAFECSVTPIRTPHDSNAAFPPHSDLALLE